MHSDRSAWLSRLKALFAIDLRSLALFRVSMGLILLVDLASRARLLAENYSDAGAHPRWATLVYSAADTLPSLHMLSGSLRFQQGLFLLAAAAALALALGWRTRLATFVSWLLLDSLVARHQLLTDGGDHLLRFLLFWSLFLPLGARASLDALRRGAAPAASFVCSPGSAALLLQAACLFFMTGLLKTGPEWADGSAISYAINRQWWILPFGEWLLAHPPLPQLLTPAVRYVEMLGPLLLFVPVATAPLRGLGIVSLWGMLAGLALGLDLNLFPWIAGGGLLPFVPAAFWDVLARRWPRLRAHTGAAAAPAHGLRRVASAAQGTLVLALLMLVLWINASSANRTLTPPAALMRIAHFLHLQQGWFMYAPSPRHVDVWFEHRGVLVNGTALNLDTIPGGSGWRTVERAWQDYRFKYYLQKMAVPKWEEPLAAYVEWLCRQWNLDRSGAARLDRISVDSITQPIAIGDEPLQPAVRARVNTTFCPR